MLVSNYSVGEHGGLVINIQYWFRNLLGSDNYRGTQIDTSNVAWRIKLCLGDGDHEHARLPLK